MELSLQCASAVVVMLAHLCMSGQLPGMKETFTTDVLVKDIRPPVFSALLTYIYTDTLQLQKPEDITELLVLANQVKPPNSSAVKV